MLASPKEHHSALGYFPAERAEAVLISPQFLLSNPKKHYLTFQYTDDSGQGKYAIIHLDKKNACEAVACAEAHRGGQVLVRGMDCGRPIMPGSPLLLGRGLRVR